MPFLDGFPEGFAALVGDEVGAEVFGVNSHMLGEALEDGDPDHVG